MLGNFGWPRYLSSCSSWLHILFVWLFLWRVFTKVSTTFLISFSFTNQRYDLFSPCEKSPAEAWLWHHWSFLDFSLPGRVSVYMPCVYCCSSLEGGQCVLFPFGDGNTFYSHGFPETEVTISCLRHKSIFSAQAWAHCCLSLVYPLWFFPSQLCHYIAHRFKIWFYQSYQAYNESLKGRGLQHDKWEGIVNLVVRKK